MKRASVLFFALCFATSLVFSQSSPSKSRRKTAVAAQPIKSKLDQKPAKSASIVGLDFYSVTPDHAGGVWITGNAYLLRGLMVNDRRGQISAFTVPTVHAIDHPTFVSRDRGWMIDARSLFRTFDGGNEWQRVEIPDDPEIRALYFQDTNNGWVGGLKGDIYHTADAGQTWTKQKTRLNYEIHQLVFVDNLHGWAIGWAPFTRSPSKQALIRTNDGGEKWEIISNVDEDSPLVVRPVFFVNVNEGWAIDNWSNIVHTTDGGKTWNIQSPHDGKSFHSLFFINDREGWVCGDGILHTADGGETWEYQRLRRQGDPSLESITFTDRDHGWAVGMNGALRTTNGGKTWEVMPDSWKATIPSFGRIIEENSRKSLSERQ